MKRRRIRVVVVEERRIELGGERFFGIARREDLLCILRRRNVGMVVSGIAVDWHERRMLVNRGKVRG